MRAIGLILVAVSLLWGSPPAAARAQLAREYEIKAAFVYNVAKFVDWPPQAVPRANEPWRLLVVGRDAGSVMQTALAGKRLHDRPLQVVLDNGRVEFHDSHMLFIASDAGPEAREALWSTRGLPVLTVVEEGTMSAGAGAVIRLGVADTRLVFDADLAAARDRSLSLKANLLSLARAVHGAAR